MRVHQRGAEGPGIALFGVLTANAAFFIEEEGEETADLGAKLDEVLLHLDAIERELNAP